MKKVILMSNRPWLHVEYLNKLCEAIDYQVEAVLCTESLDNLESFFWYDESFYQKVKKDLKIETVIHHDSEKWNELANRYIEDEEAIILADIESTKDRIFQFLSNHQETKNVIYITRKQENIAPFYQTFGEEKDLMILEHTSNYQIALDTKEYQLIKSKISRDFK